MRHDVAPRVTARARSGTGASASIAATTSSQDRSVFESPDAGARRVKGGEIQTETLPRKHKPDRLRRSWLPALKGASPAHGAAASPADISGADPAQAVWPDLGYAGAYLGSYEIFVALREQGVIPAGVRFQVEYPTPLASISGYIVPEQQQALLGSYERTMFADLRRLLAAIPSAEVAVQWDVAVEFGILEEAFAPGGAQAFHAIIAALARCIDQVPAEIPAGLHLCYGDYGHQHFKQPESLALQVRVLNAVSAAAGRPVSFVSFTVPQYQREESYFAPLAQLTTDPGTELNFALVPYHPAEQAPGTTGAQVRLIDMALAASPDGSRDWGICTECGMGRAGRDEIPQLLDLHRQIIAAR